MSQTQQDDVYVKLASFNDSVFSSLVLASIKRQLTPDEANLLHRACDLKLEVDDLSGI
jgi:hypothetical protein